MVSGAAVGCVFTIITVESNEADAKTRGALGLAVPGPVHDHLIV